MNHQPNTPASLNEAVADSLQLCISDLRHSAIVDDAHDMLSCVLAVCTRLDALTAPGAAIDAREQEVPFGIIDPDYARYYTLIRTTAWQCGYAIGLHGSFTRDLDLIAVPWTAQALPPDLLIKQVEYRTDLRRQEEAFRAKPHGRMCWSLLLPGFTDPRWIDLSVMPALASREEAPTPSEALSPATVAQPVDALRAEGWSVAVHNDYKLQGVPYTFWLFTKGDRAVKGEGQTDAEALAQVCAAIGLAAQPCASQGCADAGRYRFWRDAMLREDPRMLSAMAVALPAEVGDTRRATAAEWDAAIDASKASLSTEKKE